MNTLEKQKDLTLIKLLFVKKSREMSDNIAAYIDTKGDDMQWQIMHDIEWCGNPKSFYEKEIPFRIENQIRKDMQLIPEAIVQQYAKNMNWLLGYLKGVGCKEFNVPLSDYSILTTDYCQERLNLIDIPKTQLYSRLGTLFVALCFSGFGIGAFVGSMLCGTAAEELLLSSSHKSKERIKQIVPTIIANYKLQMKAHILGVLAKVDSNIMNELNKIKL